LSSFRTGSRARRECEHLYLTERPKEHYYIHPQDLRIELRNFYSNTAYSSAVKKSVRIAFPDFHRRKYQGEDMDFVELVKSSLGRVSYEKE
jgi:hypothetical protein